MPAHREQVVHADEPYFFLAYPHTPEQPWVERLYQDLCREVLERSTLPPLLPLHKVGFMDRSTIPVGGNWRYEVAEALARCRTFVPLYSPRYFHREECGKEWDAFVQRIIEHTARHNGRPAAIVPALWLPVDDEDMPLVARDVQCEHRLLGDFYAEEGFYTLIKNRTYEQQYRTAVQQLAKQIVRSADTCGLHPGPAEDYTSLRNVFAFPSGSAPAIRRITVTVVAPAVGHLPSGRNPAHYGPSAGDWNPYYPDSQQSLVSTAVEIVRNRAYETTVATLDEGFETLMARDINAGLGVLLVDAFAVADPTIAAKLASFDELDNSWVGTLVPWNRDDPQLQSQSKRLREELNRVLGRRLTATLPNRPLAVNAIPTLKDFQIKLRHMLDTVELRLLNEMPTYPPVGEQLPQPRLMRPASRPWQDQERHPPGPRGVPAQQPSDPPTAPPNPPSDTSSTEGAP